MSDDTGRTDETRDEALARMVREGLRPDEARARLELARMKLAGEAPLGVDARDPRARRAIGSAGALLGVLHHVCFGGVATLLGVAFLWAGLDHGVDVKVLAWGAGFLALGLWTLRDARKSWRALRAILRA